METRQKIKQEEEDIRILISTDDESAAVRAWNRMIDFFTVYDYLEGDDHVSIIKYIYLTKRYQDETCYCMAWKNYVAERTLYRYRKKYILCFKWYYCVECNGNADELLT